MGPDSAVFCSLAGLARSRGGSDGAIFGCGGLVVASGAADGDGSAEVKFWAWIVLVSTCDCAETCVFDGVFRSIARAVVCLRFTAGDTR